jgi:hypothetical protein
VAPGGTGFSATTPNLIGLDLPSGVAPNYVALARPSSSADLLFTTRDVDANNPDTLTATGVCDGDWHMFTAIVRANPQSGENAKELYVDGTIDQSTASLTGTYDARQVTSIRVGHTGSGFQWLGRIDQLLILPFAASAGLVSSWWSLFSSAVTPAFPRMRVEGGIVTDNYVEATGRVTNIRNLQAASAAVWRNNMRVVEFELREA